MASTCLPLRFPFTCPTFSTYPPTFPRLLLVLCWVHMGNQLLFLSCRSSLRYFSCFPSPSASLPALHFYYLLWPSLLPSLAVFSITWLSLPLRLHCYLTCPSILLPSLPATPAAFSFSFFNDITFTIPPFSSCFLLSCPQLDRRSRAPERHQLVVYRQLQCSPNQTQCNNLVYFIYVLPRLCLPALSYLVAINFFTTPCTREPLHGSRMQYLPPHLRLFHLLAYLLAHLCWPIPCPPLVTNFFTTRGTGLTARENYS